ncbi:uncharacterized protein [Amphiura filiformis]|uniref:uncharacterized protein n=1 Tax=Amphiura filiformis TaxID=82378 RepID=UPI003B228C42
MNRMVDSIIVRILLSACIFFNTQEFACAQTPYYGKEIGQFVGGNNGGATQHGVQGTVYAIDDFRIWIVGFSYDGAGPDAFIWAGNTSQPDSTGEIIPVEYGSEVKLGSYNNENLVIQLPKGKRVSDYKWISIWCRMFAANFGQVLIPDGFEAPSEYLLTTTDGSGNVVPLELGFPRRVHNVHADKVYIMDTRRIRLENLDYDGNGPQANYWIGSGNTPNSDGWAAWDENWSDQYLPYSSTEAFNQKTVIITIPPPYTIYDIGYIGLWCIAFSQDFGHVDIPDLTNANIPPYLEVQGPYFGKELGCFVGGPNNAPTSYDVDGQLYAVDSSTLLIKGFTYNGQAPATYLWVGTTDTPSGDGQIIPVEYSNPKLRAYNNEDVYVSLPRGSTFTDFKWISVWCQEAGASFGHVNIPSDFVAPAEHDLNQEFGFVPEVHGVSATGVYVIDDRTIRIENLDYDGNAPDSYYWTAPGWSPDSNGWIALDSENGDMMLPADGIGYTDKTVIISMPVGYTVFDVGHIGIWCRLARQDFGHVKIPPRSQLNVPPKIEKPGYYGALIGEFENTVHGVSGTIYAIDNSRLWLVGFSYDGLGPDTYIYGGTTEVPAPGGEIIPIDYARKNVLLQYINEDVVVRLPKGKYITDYKWISVWCLKAATSFGRVFIPSDFQPPAEVSIGQLGFDPPSHAVHANVFVIDTQRFRLENLYYDGLGPDAYYWYGPEDTPNRDGLIPLDENWSMQMVPSDGNGFINTTAIITIPEPMTVFDIGYLGLWCELFSANFGHITMPGAHQLTVPPYVEDEGAYYGADLGAFSGDGAGSTTLHGVDGTVFAIDDTRIQIIGFSYDGAGPDAYLYVGTTDAPSGDGTIIPVKGSLEKLPAFDKEDIIVTLPAGMTISDFKWISVWCRQAAANFGHVRIPTDFVTPSIHTIQQPLGYDPLVHQVQADSVEILDTRRVRITNLAYDGQGPDTYYWAGKGAVPDANGFIVSPEDNSSAMLPNNGVAVMYDSVILLLPEGTTVFDIDYISLWCKQASASFGHVEVPDKQELNIPPYVFLPEEPYYGKELGAFSLDGSNALHGVTGTVHAMDDTRLWITGFSYDGLGPDAFLWVGTTDDPGAVGYIVPVNGSSNKLGAYNDAELIVTLPDGMTLNHYKWISVWCRQAAANFGHVRIPTDFVAPSIHTIQQPLGYDPLVHQVQADSVEILDTRRVRITNLTYDGQGPDTYYWAGKGAVPDVNGFIVSPEDNSSAMLPNNGVSVMYDSVILLLPEGTTVFDIDYISLWCKQASASFGHVEVPDKQELNIPPYVFIPEKPYYGKELGAFSLDGSNALHGVAGTIYAMDDTRLWITGFSYDGLGPDAFLWVGTTDDPGSVGYIVPVNGSTNKLGAYTDAELIVTLPDGMTLNHYKWISVWCRQAAANFGHVRIPADFVAPSIHTIQQPLGYDPLVHQVQADSVEILDTRRVRITNLAYDGQGPDTYYWAGKGAVPDVNGFIVSPEDNSSAMLPNNGVAVMYDSVILLLPEGTTVFDIDYISLWCKQASASFGHVEVPDKQELNIPPYVFIPKEPYYGKELGAFSLDGSNALHGVAGTVYAMDDTRLWITGFSYDGLGPDAFLWVGTTDDPGSVGYIVPVNGSTNKLGAYNDAELIVTLPDGMTLNHYKWISVWCRQAAANFGHVRIPTDFVTPSIHTIQQPLGYDPLVHQVQADSVEILDTRRVRITNLAYDGQGPDTYYWAGKGALPDANGFIVSPEDGSSAMLPNNGVAVMYDSVILLLPEGTTVFDIDYISLWCKQASASFGHVEVPDKQELNIPPYVFIPEAPYYGKELGAFSLDGSNALHGVAGTVYAMDDTRLWITGFSYDGLGPDAFLWVGTTDDPGAVGYIIPVDGSSDKLGAYTNAELIVTLPDGMTLNHYKWISVWCRQAAANFGHVRIPADFVAPSIHTIQQPLGYDPLVHQVQADSVEILDTRRIRITNLMYDGQGPDTYYWAGKGAVPDVNGFIVSPEDGSSAMLPTDGVAVMYDSVILLLPEGTTVFDIDYISLWCKQASASFGHVEVPDKQELNIPPYIFIPEAPYYGKELGEFSLDGSNALHGVTGTVYAMDDTRLWITGFSYDGLGPDAFLWVGTTDDPGAVGYIVPVDGSSDKLGAYTDVELIVTLPDGMTLNDYKWISVWCRQAAANFGHVRIPTDFVAPSIHTIQQPLGYDPLVHQVQADSVEILDTRRVRITNLAYDGQGPDTYYWAGKGAVPDANGFIVSPEDGSSAMLPNNGVAVMYDSVILLLPEDTTVFDIDYIGLWCKQASASFGHVEVPDKEDLNIPPYVFIPEAPYYGKELGAFSLDGSNALHGVTGTVYTMDDTRLWITGFSYDGLGPDAFLWVGTTDDPGAVGYIVPVNGSSDKLGAYNDAELIVTLPDGMTLNHYKWISVWCRQAAANFGHVRIPTDFVAPSLHTIQQPLGYDPLVHQVQADSVEILDTRRIRITNLTYDGQGPDTYYWAGKGLPDANGFIVSPEDGSSAMLPNNGVAVMYDSVILLLPEGTTVFDIDYISLWCKQASASFGHVEVPDKQELNIPPYYYVPRPEDGVFDNCEVLLENKFHVSWTIENGDTIAVELKGKAEPGFYLGFGISGSDTRTLMIGADVAIGWIDQNTNIGHVKDYYLSQYGQCIVTAGSGACPDTISNPSGGNDIELVQSSFENGITTIVYRRPLNTGEADTDKVIRTDQPMYIAWGIGPINPTGTAAKHHQRTVGDVTLDFGRQSSTCPEITADSGGMELTPWEPANIVACDQTTTFRATMGQAGGVRGYEGITGKSGWGIAWYLNDEIIPVLTLTRGVTYTFEVWGGDNAAQSAQYHPFYITDDPLGGYFQLSPAEQQAVTIFAGPVEGPLCSWESTPGCSPDDYNNFAGYRDNCLTEQCAAGSPGILTWTPDENTPDLVYYHCYTHRFLGWKIHVVDSASQNCAAYNNCEVLVDDTYHVSWSVTGELIDIELRGRVDPGAYLAFGISGSVYGSQMLGADVAVGWIDKMTGEGMVEDYHLNSYEQCVVTSGSGACPDTTARPLGVASVTIVKSSYENGITAVSYRRKLDTGDANGDKIIRTDQPMYIVWGIGNLNPSGTVAKHNRRTIGNVEIDFGRQGSTCPALMPPPVAPTPDPDGPWTPVEIIAGEDITVFRATMGQAGGRRGYEGITGRTGWGIAWYLNNEIIPVLTLTRGVTYTFEVLGGDNAAISAQYHPFYITDDPTGGYFQLSEAEQQAFTIFAGPAEGPLCSWESTLGCSPDDYSTFAGYRDNCLTEQCAAGSPGILTWTPDENTPDLVYYHCYTHRYLGWKINVVDPPPVDTTYYGKLIGELSGDGNGSPTLHSVAGKVYAIDDRTLWFRDFTFDGNAPDAHFWLGSSAAADASGDIAAFNPMNPREKLGAYNNQHVVAVLLPGKTLSDYTWISVWCVQAGANFGQVLLSSDFVAPAEHDLGMLGTDPPSHDVTADRVVILNTRQFLIENLNYDGLAPDTFYWAGKGTPDENGFIVLDENLTENKLETALIDVTVTITLPEGKTMFDIDYISLWCRTASANFGHVVIPPMEELSIPPYIEAGGMMPDMQYNNCEVLIEDEFHASWTIDGDMIEVSLNGRVEPGTYLAFGRSGSDTRTAMVQSDVSVVWIDGASNTGRAVDYKINDYAQCSRGFGACPDEMLRRSAVNDVELLGSSFRNGVTTVSYRRPLDTGDPADLKIPTDQPIYVSWAIGSINNDGTVAKHDLRTPGDLQINFGRPSSGCPSLVPTDGGPGGEVQPWKQEEIGGEKVKFFRADIGQSGGKKGYEGITGHTGLGISWYINWKLIPIITVRRGVTYTFDIFGGDDPNLSAAYHPFYITNDPDGGYVQLSEQEKQNVTIYAGPTDGSLCEWVSNGIDKAPEEYATFDEYRDGGLVRKCQGRKNGVLTWTPDLNTPDVVYYQCYTHKFLGWKIHVVDSFPPPPNPTVGERGSTTRITVSIAAIVFSFLLSVFVLCL